MTPPQIYIRQDPHPLKSALVQQSCLVGLLIKYKRTCVPISEVPNLLVRRRRWVASRRARQRHVAVPQRGEDQARVAARWGRQVGGKAQGSLRLARRGSPQRRRRRQRLLR